MSTKTETPYFESVQGMADWPYELQLPLLQGLIWTLAIFLESLLVWDWVYPKLTTYLHLSPIMDELISVIIKVINIIVMLSVLMKFGNFNIREMIFFQPTSVGTSIKWLIAGLCFTSYNLVFYFPLGMGVQLPNFITQQIITIFYFSILAPIKEEILFRGLFYGTLRTRFGKVGAIVLSVIVFVVLHDEFWALMGHNDWGFVCLKLSFFVMVSFLLAYIYESTHSLIFCMCFHGAANLTHNIAPLIGFVYGGYLADIP